MKQNDKILLDILNAYLNNKKYTTDKLDIPALYAFAKGHNLAPITFSVIKDIVPAKNQNGAYSAFKDDFYDAIVRYDAQNAVQKDLTNLLSQNGIKHVFFKGSVLKDMFPTPELRVMGDIDLLISKDNRDKVKAILCKNGYDLINSNGPVYDYKKDDVLIEMHTKIISGKVGSSNAEEYFANAINNAQFDEYKGCLNPDYHFEYLIAHIAHHFWFYGAGIKLIVDLAAMLKCYNINLDKVVSNLKSINLDKFAKIIITICYKWFGFGKEYDVDTEDTESFLLSFGAFGNVNRNESAVIQRKALEEGTTSNFSVKLKLLFPSYKKMKNIPYITFMEGRPYLLPVGWIYRIFYNFKNKKDFISNATASIGSQQTKRQAQAELLFFEEIGLV